MCCALQFSTSSLERVLGQYVDEIFIYFHKSFLNTFYSPRTVLHHGHVSLAPVRVDCTVQWSKI